MSKIVKKWREERKKIKIPSGIARSREDTKIINNNNCCIIDLTCNNDLDEPVVINLDENEVPDHNMVTKGYQSDYSNISSTDFKNTDEHSNIIDSTEEVVLSSLEEFLVSQKKKTHPAKQYHDFDDNSREKSNIFNSEQVLITITNENARKTYSRNSFLKYKHTSNKKNQRCEKKLRRRKCKEHKKKRNDDVNFITTDHCNCCKCIKFQSNSKVPHRPEEYKLCARKNRQSHQSTLESHNDIPLGKIVSDKREGNEKEKNNEKANQAKTESPLKSLVDQDRPLPQCLRGCRRSKIIHNDQLVWKQSKPSNYQSKPGQFEDQRKDIYTHKDDVARRIVSKTNSPCNSKTDLIDIDLTESGKTTPVAVIKCDSDETILKDVHDDAERIKSNLPPRISGILKLVPIETLMYQEPKENSDTSVDVQALLKVKPVGTVKPTLKINENNISTVTEDKDDNLKLRSEQKQKILQKERKIHPNIAIALREETYIKPIDIKVAEGTNLNDRYIICDIIKKGCYSNVVRAIDKQNGDKIILKVLHRNKYSHALYNLKLLNGVDAVDKFHCIRLKGQFYVRGHLTLWLESYGSNLRECLNKQSHDNRFPFPTVQLLSRQLLLAVQLLREYDIIHGDIKPEHILINSTNTNIKLTGFDGARHIKNNLNAVPCLGPINYQAPEVILDLDVDHSVDVWSAACVIYEVATGKRLFGGVTENDVLWEIMNMNGKFPKYMQVAKHFDAKGRFIHTFVNCKTRKTECNPVSEVRAAERRDLKAELTRASGAAAPAAAGEDRLVQLLNTALHTMLLVEPNRRVSIDFALLNHFFQLP